MFARRRVSDESSEARQHRQALIEAMTFEVVPLKTLPPAIDELPVGATVSVTCSPVKGIDETVRVTEELKTSGFEPIPHIAARLVRDRNHTIELASWCRSTGIDRMFVVGGDSEESGAYLGAVEFISDLLDTDHGLQTIGVTAYPDGHALLSDEVVARALRDKQAMFAEAGIDGYCTTQMCFDPNTIAKWMRRIREEGIDLPIHLGIPGVVDRTKLLTMGARLGIGASLSYLRKNRTAITKLMTATSYDPNDLLKPLSEDLLQFGVDGLHVFTFNQVGATNEWRVQSLAD
ncbi:MAG: methylenetetrahydrofolate reductase [Acidimicrobiales bacterium]